jgi:hypothetical protein
MRAEPNPIETIQNPNAVEEFICKAMDKASRVEMSKDDTELLVQLLMVGKPIPLSTVKKVDKYFLYELIEKRVEHCFTFKIPDSRAIVFISAIAKSAGTAVMYLTYLQYKCKKSNRTELTLDYLCELFPIGFIPESELKAIWDKQKVMTKSMGGSDNLLDYQSAMKSIQFHTENSQEEEPVSKSDGDLDKWNESKNYPRKKKKQIRKLLKMNLKQ